MQKIILKGFVILLAFLWMGAANTYASDTAGKDKNAFSGSNLQSLLIQLIKNHNEIKSAKSKVEQAKADYSKSKGLYYPTLDFNAEGGRDYTDKEYASDTTDETRYEVNLRASQLISDFGKTTSIMGRSDVLVKQAQLKLKATEQELILQGIKAYINIIKARERLNSARYSESRIKELTGIEKTLVEKGAGLSSDVLQAKSQLSGAMALRVDAQGELALAKNRFQAVFYRYPTDLEIAQFQDIDFPFKHLPIDLEEAINMAIKENPELKVTRYTGKVAQKDIDIAKTAFYPRLGLFAEALRKDNDDGDNGYSNEAYGGVELSYNIFNGGSDKAALNAALAAKKAAFQRTDSVQQIIREQVSNSWEQLTILKNKSELLEQQAGIVENFLELAKKERKMGTRPLLDVLNGEINLINAVSTAITAQQDTKIAAYNLLFSMGRIDLALFE